MRICFVCLGNICRSPTAEGVFRKLVEQAGLADVVVIDSAGTGGWHAGELPDSRSSAAAKTRGYNLVHRARKFTAADFGKFDLILTMDRSNYENVMQLARGRNNVPPIKLLREFDKTAPLGAEVPDPYSGDARGFEDVLDICERACRGLLDVVRERI
jgi:protein-tyrosine phosphatase